MDSVTEQSNLLNRRAELEQQKALLQTSALMRLRTGQQEDKLSELAHKRISQQLEKLDKEEQKMAQNSVFHLENLPFDPAQEAGRYSQEVISIEEANLRQKDLDRRLKSMTYEEIEKLASDLM